MCQRSRIDGLVWMAGEACKTIEGDTLTWQQQYYEVSGMDCVYLLQARNQKSSLIILLKRFSLFLVLRGDCDCCLTDTLDG